MGSPSRVTHPVEVAPGDTRDFHELTMGGYAALQSYVNKAPRPPFVVPDLAGPLSEVAERIGDALVAADLSEDGRIKVLAEFRRECLRLAADQIREFKWEAGQWPPEVGTEEGGRVLLTGDGGKAHFLWVMLKQQRPETTKAEALALFDAMPVATFYEVLAIGFGSRDRLEEAKAAEGDGDPKAPGGPASGS
jgi:hypothetical protein